MENKLMLTSELKQLESLIGKWSFKGSFRNNPDKLVDGWETYDVIDNGKAILCAGETRTILSGKVIDVYKNTMKILFNSNSKKIIGGNEWEISIVQKTLIFQNERHRFTGQLNKLEAAITGQWENVTAEGIWKYWYDKIMIKQNKI
jgi:hypothetical protein